MAQRPSDKGSLEDPMAAVREREGRIEAILTARDPDLDVELEFDNEPEADDDEEEDEDDDDEE